MICELDSIRIRCKTAGSTAAEWWWCLDESLTVISSTLINERYVVLDEFLTDPEASELREEVQEAYRRGLLASDGVIGGGKIGRADRAGAVLDKETRGDVLGYFEGNEEKWPGGKNMLQRCLAKMNTVVSELRTLAGEQTHVTQVRSELQHVVSRSKAMVTCYPGAGARYTRHVDNAIGNGRKLTCIYYLNSPDWTSADGGSLLLHGPVNSEISSYGEIEIAPIFNRLLLFWSDIRCPHEVLPCYRERFAVTAWFIDSVEKALAIQQEQIKQASMTSAEKLVHLSSITMNECENLVTVKIKFAEGISPLDVNVDISETMICISPADPSITGFFDEVKKISLPIEIDRERSKAKFIEKGRILVITLPQRMSGGNNI